MKKFSTLALVCGLFSAPICAQADWNGNWLLGVSGGYNWYDNDFDVTLSVPAGNFQFNSARRDFDSRGSVWGILGGYQAFCNEWLLGAELNVDWEGHTHTHSHLFATQNTALSLNASTSYKRDATVGLTGRLGYQLACWLLPYLRAGIETSKDHYSVTLAEAGDPTIGFNGNTTERSYRFVGGAGLEVPVPACDGLSFRAEYNYHSSNKSLDLSGSWFGPVVATSTSSSDNHTNSAKISVVYNFGF